MSTAMNAEPDRQIIPGYEPGSGDQQKDDALTGISSMFGGMVPNFHKVLANSTAVVTAFEAMRRNLQKTQLRAVEREIVAVEVSRRTRCHYCLSAHSTFASKLRMSTADIDALRTGRPLSNPRQALVQRATMRLWETQGRLSEDEIGEFNDAGLSTPELLEVIAVIGWYVLSTMVNNLARTEIDDTFVYMEGGSDRGA
jgi:uncharacterized peroxidase-related enzyme